MFCGKEVPDTDNKEMKGSSLLKYGTRDTRGEFPSSYLCEVHPTYPLANWSKG